MKIWGLFLLTCLWAQTNPLVLEHADSLVVSRSGGTYSLFGNVKITHDSTVFRAQKAVWNKNTNKVRFSGGFRLNHPQGSLKARKGFYDRNSEIAVAEGNVRASDSGGVYISTAGKAKYQKLKHLLDMYQSPIVYWFEVDSADTTKIDTLTMKADRMQIEDQKQMSIAWGNVILTKGNELTVKCDSGIYENKDELLQLFGSPHAQVEKYSITGVEMKIWLQDRQLDRVLVLEKGHALQSPDSTSEEISEVFGDTLSIQFQKGKPSDLRAQGTALGMFYHQDEETNRNKVNGGEIRMVFEEGEPDYAMVSRTAKAVYHYFDEKKVHQGENEALGDSMKIRFQKRAMDGLQIFGRLGSGIYYGKDKDENTKN